MLFALSVSRETALRKKCFFISLGERWIQKDCSHCLHHDKLDGTNFSLDILYFLRCYVIMREKGGVFMRKIVCIFLVVVIVFSLSACSGGISGDEAKSHINDFFEKVSSEDYEAAEEFLHPERPADLKEFFENFENETNVDLSSMNIEKYTNFKSSWYDSSVDGSTYSLTMTIKASDKTFQMEIEIVKNDGGYGIYNLYVDVD